MPGGDEVRDDDADAQAAIAQPADCWNAGHPAGILAADCGSVLRQACPIACVGVSGGDVGGGQRAFIRRRKHATEVR